MTKCICHENKATCDCEDADIVSPVERAAILIGSILGAIIAVALAITFARF